MIRFDHVNIRVSDQETVRDFLAAVIGLTSARAHPSPSTATGSISATCR